MEEDECLTIREVYYEGDNPAYYSADPIAPLGETHEELANDLKRMLGALEKSALKADDFADEDAVETHWMPSTRSARSLT
jgi:hypothetical protein